MTRRRIMLDGQWEFYPDPSQRLRIEGLQGEEAARSIQVPGPWQAQFEDLRDYTGVAWYRRLIDPVESGPGMWILHFGAVGISASALFT